MPLYSGSSREFRSNSTPKTVCPKFRSSYEKTTPIWNCPPPPSTMLCAAWACHLPDVRKSRDSATRTPLRFYGCTMRRPWSSMSFWTKWLFVWTKNLSSIPICPMQIGVWGASVTSRNAHTPSPKPACSSLVARPAYSPPSLQPLQPRASLCGPKCAVCSCTCRNTSAPTSAVWWSARTIFQGMSTVHSSMACMMSSASTRSAWHPGIRRGSCLWRSSTDGWSLRPRTKIKIWRASGGGNFMMCIVDLEQINITRQYNGN